jgi:hypothetical protein
MMRRSKGVLAATVGLVVAAIGFTAGPANGRGRGHTQVLCLTHWSNAIRSHYRRTPSRCDLHHRGQYPIYNIDTERTKGLHWSFWHDGSRASARGKIYVSSAGFNNPVRLVLERPRRRCGRSVFTKAEFFENPRVNGHVHHFHGSMPLDGCPP